MSLLPLDSLGVFPNNTYPFSSLFCSESFMQQRTCFFRPEKARLQPAIPLSPLKAGYSTPSACYLRIRT
jgi:hypothetical protein